jgi:peptide-methionine (R)-S-oxide reductase
MNRRSFLTTALAGVGVVSAPTLLRAGSASTLTPEVVKMALQQANQPAPKIDKLELSDAEWKQRLGAPAYAVLRKEGTERPFTSPLNDEKRKGVFHCSGCDHPVFTSEMKFDSGTGWPSFFTTLPGAFEKSRDFKLLLPRTEYHCAKCGGHHGHVFNDGPEPTKQRWCNNGVSLVFKAA